MEILSQRLGQFNADDFSWQPELLDQATDGFGNNLGSHISEVQEILLVLDVFFLKWDAFVSFVTDSEDAKSEVLHRISLSLLRCLPLALWRVCTRALPFPGFVAFILFLPLPPQSTNFFPLSLSFIWT